MQRSLVFVLFALFIVHPAPAQRYQWTHTGTLPPSFFSSGFLTNFFIDSLDRISVPVEPMSTTFLRTSDGGVTWEKRSDTLLFDLVSGWIIWSDSGGVVAKFEVWEHGIKGGTVVDPHQWFADHMESLRENTCPAIAVTHSNKLLFPNVVILASNDTMRHIRMIDIGGRIPEGYYYNIDSVIHYDMTFSASSILRQRDSTIVVGTRSGIFYTRDEGKSWQRSNSGLTDTVVMMIRLTRSGDIIAMTDSGRFFRGKKILASVRNGSEGSFPSAMTVDQNFPNPFNPVTTIRFTLPIRGTISVNVADILGRTVAVLAEGQFLAGTHEVQWNAEGCPSGVYYYTVQQGTQRRTRRMLLLK